MTIELNMRLDTKRGLNNYELFTQRKQIAIDYLGKYGEVSHRRFAFWPGHCQILILSVLTDDIPLDALVELAEVMLKDCIGVYLLERLHTGEEEV